MHGNGNGHHHYSAPESDTQRLTILETQLEAMQQVLETQFTRIATLQGQLDRLLATRREH